MSRSSKLEIPEEAFLIVAVEDVADEDDWAVFEERVLSDRAEGARGVLSEKRDGVAPDSEEGGVDGPDDDDDDEEEESSPGKEGLGVMNCSAGSSSKSEIADEGEDKNDIGDAAFIGGGVKACIIAGELATLEDNRVEASFELEPAGESKGDDAGDTGAPGVDARFDDITGEGIGDGDGREETGTADGEGIGEATGDGRRLDGSFGGTGGGGGFLR